MIIININNYTDFYSNNNILETRKLRIDKLIQRDNSLIFEQNTIKFRCEEELLVLTECCNVTNEKSLAKAIANHVKYCDKNEIYSPHSMGEMIHL